MNKNYINSCLRWLSNEIFPFYSSSALPEALMDKVNTFYHSISSCIDWYTPSKEELLGLGFLNWEELDDPEDDSGVWFIPSWLFPIIPEGLQVYDTNGTPFTFNCRTAPKDVMYGCLTFGLVINSRKVALTDE